MAGFITLLLIALLCLVAGFGQAAVWLAIGACAWLALWAVHAVCQLAVMLLSPTRR